MFLARRNQLTELAAKNRLPAIYAIKEHAEAGGLMAHAASRPEIFRRAAAFVDKILKGANPAELPVEQPTKISVPPRHFGLACHQRCWPAPTR